MTDLLTSMFPIEIVCYVFEAYVNSYVVDLTDSPGYNSLERPRFFDVVHRRAPLMLGAVCHRWRVIAWSHPRLWTSLFVFMPCPRHDLAAELVSEWLERSADLPIDIRIDDIEYGYHPTASGPHALAVRKSTKAIVHVINRFSAKWRGLDLAGVAQAVLSELDDSELGTDTHPTHLRYLSVGGGYDARQYLPTSSILNRSQRKHRPTHLGLMSETRYSHINLDWTFLTELHLSDMPRRACFEALNLASHSPITHLAFTQIDDYSRADLDYQAAEISLTLSFLIHLSIHEEAASPETTKFIFSTIQSPALKSLHYDGYVYDTGYFELPAFPAGVFIDFVNRCGCRLKDIVLSDPIVSDDDLLKVFNELPTLQSLKISLQPINSRDSIFNHNLQDDLGSKIQALLPELSELELTYLPPNDECMKSKFMFVDKAS